MKGLSLIAFSVAFLGFLLSSASPLLSSSSASSSCFAVSSRQRHVHGDCHQRSATLIGLAAAAESKSDQKSAEINMEAIKSELTEYLKKRQELNADDIAKLYVRYVLQTVGLDWSGVVLIAAQSQLANCSNLLLLRPTACLSSRLFTK
jgi:hypothetical protein